MNNGYQKSNGCGADKEGGEIFNTFFYPELQSKHVARLPITQILAKVRLSHPDTKQTIRICYKYCSYLVNTNE